MKVEQRVTESICLADIRFNAKTNGLKRESKHRDQIVDQTGIEDDTEAYHPYSANLALLGQHHSSAPI